MKKKKYLQKNKDELNMKPYQKVDRIFNFLNLKIQTQNEEMCTTEWFIEDNRKVTF